MTSGIGSDLEKQYKRRFVNQVEYRNQVWRVLTADYLQQFVPPTATVLDLGCGYGQFVNNIVATSKYGMDLNPGARLYLNQTVNFIEQDCSVRWPFDDGALDVVFTSNFLEHLASKDLVRRTLDEARRCLAHNGTIILLGPNIRYAPGSYWDFWDHHVAISDRSLVEILELSAFRINRCIAKFLPFTMTGERRAPVFFLRAYLRLPIAWRFFGRQFFIVAHAN